MYRFRSQSFLLSLLAIASCDVLIAQDQTDPNHRHFSLHSVGRNQQLIAKSGATGARLILHWYQLQSGPRRVNTARSDPAVQGRLTGVDLVVTLRCNSNWACETTFKTSSRNYEKRSSMPKDMNDWKRYVTTLVERYDGDGKGDAPGLRRPIKHWQLENEFLAQWKGTDEQFIELARVTHDTIKAADPEAKIVSPGLTGLRFFAVKDGLNTRGWIYQGNSDKAQRRITGNQLRRVPRLGKMHARAKKLIRQLEPHVDIFDIHLYTSDHDDMLYQLRWMKQQLETISCEKPIWSLEFASPFFGFSDDRFHKMIITSQIIAFDQGLDRIFWSSLAPTTGWSENYQRLSLATNDGQPKSAFAYYATLANNLEGFTAVSREATDESVHLYRFRFAGNRKDAFVAWTTDKDVTLSIDFDVPMMMLEFSAGKPQSQILGSGSVEVAVEPMPCLIVPEG